VNRRQPDHLRVNRLINEQKILTGGLMSGFSTPHWIWEVTGQHLTLRGRKGGVDSAFTTRKT